MVKSLWPIYGSSLIHKYGLHCFYCGRRVVRTILILPQQATIEHIIPKSKGGKTELDNLTIACFACNQEKGDGDFLPFFRKKAKVRQAEGRMRRYSTKAKK